MVALTVLLAAAVACYLVVRASLRGQVDDALTEQGALLQRPGGRFGLGGRARATARGGPGAAASAPDALPGPPARRGGARGLRAGRRRGRPRARARRRRRR